MVKLWHDDIRRPPDDSWKWARTNYEAKAILLLADVDVISLDHDMGLERVDPDIPDADLMVTGDRDPDEDGTELVNWMIETGNLPSEIRIHSWNPAGASRMALALRDAGVKAIEVRPYSR